MTNTIISTLTKLTPIFFIMGMLVSPLSMAGKIYKAIDADGKVYFTDKDPSHISDIKAVKSEKISIKKDSSNKTRVVTAGDSSYCGHIQLPKKSNSNSSYYKNRPEYYYENLSRKRREWKRNLENHEKQIASQSYHYNRYSSYRYRRSSNYNKTHNPENIEKMRDYRCALAWADQQANTLNSQQSSLDQTIHQLKTSLEKLQNTQKRVCGSEPTYDPSDAYLLDKWKRWNNCNNKYNSLINDTAQKINHNDSELSNIRSYLHSLNSRP